MKYNYDCDEWDLEKRIESDHSSIKPLITEKIITLFHMLIGALLSRLGPSGPSCRKGTNEAKSRNTVCSFSQSYFQSSV